MYDLKADSAYYPHYGPASDDTTDDNTYTLDHPTGDDNDLKYQFKVWQKDWLECDRVVGEGGQTSRGIMCEDLELPIKYFDSHTVCPPSPSPSPSPSPPTLPSQES